MRCLQRLAWFSVIFETFSKQKTILIIHILFLIYLINWIYVKKWFFSVGFVYCSIKQFSLNLKPNQQTLLFHFSKNNRILNRLSGLYTNQPPCIVFRWFIYTSLRGPLIKLHVKGRPIRYLIHLGNKPCLLTKTTITEVIDITSTIDSPTIDITLNFL